MTHLLLQLRGGYISPENAEEQWQVGIRYWFDNSVPDDSGTFPTVAVTTDFITGTETQGTWEANWASTLWDPTAIVNKWLDPILALATWSGFSSDVALQEWRVYVVDDDGKVVLTPAGEPAKLTFTFNGSGLFGANTGGHLPLEVAMGISWTSYRAGPKGRGRIYWPAPPTSTLVSTGRFDPDDCDTAATTWSSFLVDTAVESVLPNDIHVRPVVTGPSDWTKYSVIRVVRVGDVPDAQRRRRNRLLESYSSDSPSYG